MRRIDAPGVSRICGFGLEEVDISMFLIFLYVFKDIVRSPFDPATFWFRRTRIGIRIGYGLL